MTPFTEGLITGIFLTPVLWIAFTIVCEELRLRGQT